MTKNEIDRFRSYILGYYRHYGRHDLPWRQNYDPYRIMVSEIMLQQTQVDRVIPKYLQFLDTFPTLDKLATAPVAEVIKNWQGLGYNRRGLNLQRAAQKILADFGGQLPSEAKQLLTLPGIGPYTAAAIQAFAFNQPSVVIETNIRTVFIFHFFHEAYSVEDGELLPLIEATLDRDHPRRWYSALMDYGTYLKSVIPNPTRRSQTYAKQSKLEGSNRQVRGRILTALSQTNAVAIDQLPSLTGMEIDRVSTALAQLIKEGFVEYRTGEMVSLKS